MTVLNLTHCWILWAMLNPYKTSYSACRLCVYNGEQSQNDFSFAHLSFQEYFTAKYVVSNARQGTLERLLDNATDDLWSEVFLLTASLLDNDSDEFFDLFANKLKTVCLNSQTIQSLLTWAQKKQW